MIISNYRAIIFDLDGTLLDTSMGIYNSVRYTEEKMGFTPIMDDQLSLFIGPPPTEMYQSLYGVTVQIAMEATKYHREYSREKGFKEAIIYNHINSLLKKIRGKGFLLGVATLKSQDITNKLLSHFKLSDFFDAIVGVDVGESFKKADVIKIALDKFKITDVKQSVLIGDSLYDAIGAEEVGCDFIGVTYGFGFKSAKAINEFQNVGIAHSVEVLSDLIYI